MKDNAVNVILNVHFQAVAGHEEALFGLLRALIEPTRAEPGCMIYELHRHPEEAGKFMFYERFATQEALDLHVATPHFKKFSDARAAARPDPVESVVVTKWRAVG
ncbi:MAG TPA: putative quinol monooxygenase [Bryobacteraceae bacterium]|nr:putative quinol monooxygenase [Bryobacteraceae bacterium]